MALQPKRIQAKASRVTVRIPADVSFDLAKFNKVVGNLGELLGCGPCISGASCDFQIASEFLVDPATLRVKEVAIK